jgi:hypothetical protein
MPAAMQQPTSQEEARPNDTRNAGHPIQQIAGFRGKSQARTLACLTNNDER